LKDYEHFDVVLSGDCMNLYGNTPNKEKIRSFVLVRLVAMARLSAVAAKTKRVSVIFVAFTPLVTLAGS